MKKVLLTCAATSALSLLCGPLAVAASAPSPWGEAPDASGSYAPRRVEVLAELPSVAPSNPSAILPYGQRIDIAQATQDPAAGSIVEIGPEPYTWTATKAADGRVVVAGAVPDRATQQYLAVRLAGDLDDQTGIDPAAPAGFGTNLLVALDLLEGLEEGSIRFDGSTWSATGITGTPENAQAVVDASGLSWDLALSVAAAPPFASVAPATAAPAVAAPAATPATPPANDAALAQCRAQLAELSAHNAILFQSGAAVMAETAKAELDAFAAVLARCATASVYVEGHTDSDGDDRKNLALSVARAEAVVAALIERGIAPERLYAIGYGESQPVADNATSEGKRKNRRIVVTLDDKAPMANR